MKEKIMFNHVHKPPGVSQFGKGTWPQKPANHTIFPQAANAFSDIR
jgi:hypothetical protein